MTEFTQKEDVSECETILSPSKGVMHMLLYIITNIAVHNNHHLYMNLTQHPDGTCGGNPGLEPPLPAELSSSPCCSLVSKAALCASNAPSIILISHEASPHGTHGPSNRASFLRQLRLPAPSRMLLVAWATRFTSLFSSAVTPSLLGFPPSASASWPLDLPR